MARRGEDGSSGRDGPWDGGPVPGPRLPIFASALLGRECDLDDLARRLASARLLTITGPGGIGKTRLAVEVARRIDPGPAYFVDLAPLRDESLVAERVAAAFGLGGTRGRNLAALLDGALSPGTLLVLDNCEHLTGACAAVARELLVGCDSLRVLATSQQRLGVPAEIEWLVSPLELPGPGAQVNSEDGQRTAAVQLFCERAVAANPDFVSGPDELEAIFEICRRLDANPLAIELAAARVRALSPTEIAARLGRRFQLLRSAPGATEGRHQSVTAALEWSYDLLSGPEKALLRRLSVFSGPFGLDAVEGICPGGEVDPDDVLDLLSGLIAKSLVAADTSGPASRYRLAETVRLYADQCLATAGERIAVGERHARWWVRIVEAAAEGGKGAPSLRELEADVDNVRAALEWCLAYEQVELGLRLATAHMVAWQATGRVAEARDWLGRMLTISEGGNASLRAGALYHAGFAALLLGEFDVARRDVEASLAASTQAGDAPSVIERTKGLLAMVSTRQGASGVEDLERDLEEARARDDRSLLDALVGCGHARLFMGEPVVADAHFEELVAVARRRGRAGPLATGLVGLGAAALARGDCRRAGDRLREGIAVATASADVHTLVIGLIWLGELARLTADAEGARRQLKDGLARARPMGAPYPLALSLLGLGGVVLDDGDTETARRHFDEALALAAHARLGHMEAAALDGLGEAALAVDDDASAERLFERSLAVAEKCAEKTATARATYQLAGRASARGDLSRAAVLHHDALRQFHEVGVGPGVADSLDAVGGLAVEGSNPALAARLFGAAAALRRAGGWVRRARPQDRYRADVARLGERMGHDALDAAWAEGDALPAGDAVAYAGRGRGRRARATEGPNSLTRAERDVVALAVVGLTTDEIAGRLFVSPRTVHSHLRRVYSKLGVTSRRELRRRVGEPPTPD